MNYFPIQLNIRGRLCVVVGGGAIGLQKTRGLVEAGARVRVVAPRLEPEFETLTDVELLRRPFEDSDLEGALLVVAATDDPDLNHRIFTLAEAREALVNVVDDPEYCHFIYPSVLRRGDLQVTVSTGGASPALARLLRERLEPEFAADYGCLIGRMRELRQTLRDAPISADEKRRGAEELATLALNAQKQFDYAAVQARMQTLIEQLLSNSTPPDTQSSVLRTQSSPVLSPQSSLNTQHSTLSTSGMVTLVGAGPGDPELITLAGVRALREADVVVYDRLVNPALLNHAPRARHVALGKTPGEDQAAAQTSINELLVREALAGRHVVRLKGGDPAVFARGGEELDAVRPHGIPFRIIPGITAGLGAAAMLGIPLTQRELASSVVFVTGSTAAEGNARRVDWRALAYAADTIVIYMGKRSIRHIAEELIAGGRPPAEPVAIARNVTLPDQTITITNLSAVAKGILDEGHAGPAVTIIGAAVKLVGSSDERSE